MITIFFAEIHFNYGNPGFSSGNHSGLLGIITAPMAVVPMVYIVLCFSALKRYQRLLPEYYSFSEKINLNWLKYTLISLITLFIIIYSIIFISTRFHFISLNKTFTVVAAIQSIFLLFLIFFSIRQSLIIGYTVIPEQAESTPPKYVKPDEKLDELAKQLLIYMEDQKPHLAEELSLYTLAKDLNISANLLSQIINQNLGTNFYKFINSYRLKEVKKMLKDPSFHQYSILGIAFEAGFNSKSTFNKIFKEETGMTPSEFRRS
ncbi:AraC family transcriptional regulator [uncultured Chryseobacterium sp.]|uniref:helix-turn-helix domain-containing protein n=1 Tax=uncultured Chryseobacterium sp. TaxID=259322 RepID=UPI0025E96749|nr:helix-turn-helix domain-containing protein [uncultured Chryseobacterium sp.]